MINDIFLFSIAFFLGVLCRKSAGLSGFALVFLTAFYVLYTLEQKNLLITKTLVGL